MESKSTIPPMKAPQVPNLRNFNADVKVRKDNIGMIHFSIRDAGAEVPVVDLAFTPQQFAALFLDEKALASAQMHGTVKHVGKIRVTEARRANYPDYANYDRTMMSRWLEANKQEEGWFLDSNLQASNAVTVQGSSTTLNYRVYRFINRPA